MGHRYRTRSIKLESETDNDLHKHLENVAILINNTLNTSSRSHTNIQVNKLIKYLDLHTIIRNELYLRAEERYLREEERYECAETQYDDWMNIAVLLQKNANHDRMQMKV